MHFKNDESDITPHKNNIFPYEMKIDAKY